MKLVFYFSLFIIFIQCVDVKSFSVFVPLLPFSLGEILFIIVGLINYTSKKTRFNSIVFCFLVFNITGFIAAFVNEDFSTNISRSLGLFILLIASIGWSNLWSKKEFISALNIFFIVNLIYWSAYVISITYVFGNIVSYGQIYGQDDSIINHHICGMAISTSSLYILNRFLIKKNKISMFGYGLIILTFIVLVLSESRSNLFVFAIIVSLVLFYLHRFSIKSVVAILFVGYFMLFTFNYLFSDQERITQRFSMDSDYQTATNLSRVEILKRFPGEILNNPLGKGAIGGTKLLIFNIEKKNPHNQYLTFSLQGGLLAFLAVLFFLERIIFFIRNGRVLINNNRNISAGFIVMIAYWVTLLTIDTGGLLFQLILSLTFYLYNVAEKQLNISRKL